MRTLFILSATIFFIVFSFSCSQEDQSDVKFGTGTIKQPVLDIAPQSGKGGLGKTTVAVVDLPLLFWPSFEYRMINRRIVIQNIRMDRKEETCMINESDGAQLQVGTEVEVLDEARCLYVRMVTSDGVPRSYTITIMKIRLLETREEGWTWSKSIEFDK